MKMTDMRAKARAIFGPAIAEPMPKQPNGAKALQERANARPIPTYKVGGVVKKPKPPGPTPAERAESKRFRDSIAKEKVTEAQGKILNRIGSPATREFKDGGKIQTSADTAKKLATEMGGMKKGGKSKKDGLAVMIAIGSPMKGMKNMKRPVKKAVGGTATSAPNYVGPGMSATTQGTDEERRKKNEQAILAANASATAAATGKPYAGPGMSATTQGTDAERRANNAQAILQAKYSSATPNRDASATANPTTQASTPAKFDRNQALKDFNTVGRNFIGQGVPQKAVIQAQAELRKLQMDNKSTPAQHQAALQAILARMNSLVPKKVAKGGIIKKAKGGMAYAKGGEMMKPVKRAQGGAGKVRKGMMTPEGKIIAAMNKIRGK
jgi:hypothetical protein